MIPEARGTGEADNEEEGPTERLTRYIDALPDLLEDFETKHPNWSDGMLLMLLEWGLLRLRDRIEDKSDPEISWEHPFVELQFHVDCKTDGDPLAEGTFSLNTGRLNISDVRDDETASTALSELMVRHLEIITLADLTRGMAMIQSEEGFIPFFPAERIDEIRAIEDEVPLAGRSSRRFDRSPSVPGQSNLTTRSRRMRSPSRSVTTSCNSSNQFKSRWSSFRSSR